MAGPTASEGQDRSWRVGKPGERGWVWGGRLGAQGVKAAGELCRARRKEPGSVPSALGVRELGEHPEET